MPAGHPTMRMFTYATLLRVSLGGVDYECEVRIRYIGGPFQADLQAIEVRQPSGAWVPDPGLLAHYDRCPVLLDRLREHTGNVLIDERLRQARARLHG